MSEQTEEVRIAPYNSTRDLTDLLVGLLCVPIILGLFGGALWGLGYLCYVVSGDVTTAMVCGGAAGGAMALVFLLCIVWGLVLHAEGIRFRRLLGSPKFLSWDRIRRIREVSRREVVWCWLFCPWKEMTTGALTLHMYRIDWDGSYCYFPPRDIEEFCDAVERWCPGVLIREFTDDSASVDARETGNPYQSPLSDLTPPPWDDDDDELAR